MVKKLRVEFISYDVVNNACLFKYPNDRHKKIFNGNIGQFCKKYNHTLETLYTKARIDKKDDFIQKLINNDDFLIMYYNELVSLPKVKQ